MNKKTVFLPIKLNPINFLIFFLGCGVGFTLYPLVTHHSDVSSRVQTGHIEACFSPEGHCTKKIVSRINQAQTSILVQAYSFTSPRIAQALEKARRRGVKVKILIDKGQQKARHSQLKFLAKAGLLIFIDSLPGIAHNKVMIIDNCYVLTGSFNFTRAAENRNAENILFINNPELAKIYTENWNKRARKAKHIKND